MYDAFDDDSVLVQERLARPALVDRLDRSFFEADGRIYAAGRSRGRSLTLSVTTMVWRPGKPARIRNNPT